MNCFSLLQVSFEYGCFVITITSKLYRSNEHATESLYTTVINKLQTFESDTPTIRGGGTKILAKAQNFRDTLHFDFNYGQNVAKLVRDEYLTELMVEVILFG